MNDPVSREIEAALQKALQKMGIDGEVFLAGRTLSLRISPYAPVEVDVLYLQEQWPLLPNDMRDRKANDVAERLIAAHESALSGPVPPWRGGPSTSTRPVGSQAPKGSVSAAPGPNDGTRGAPLNAPGPTNAAGPISGAPSLSNAPGPDSQWGAPPGASSAPPRGASTPPLRQISVPPRASAPSSRPVVLPIGGALFVAITAVTIWLYVKDDKPSSNVPVSTVSLSNITPPGETPEARRARLCEVARKRVLETGGLADLDPQVWSAELWLVRTKEGDPDKAPGLAALVQEGRLTEEADAALAKVSPDSGAKAEIRAGEPAGPYRSAVVRFQGGYVGAFFDKEGRDKMIAVALKMANAAEAEMAFLVGKCDHLPHRDIGVWYRGSSYDKAAAALVFGSGWGAERRVTSRAVGSPASLSELPGLVASMAKVDRPTLESATKEAGAVWVGGKDAAVTVTFPLYGPTRATRAAGIIAEKAGMGAP